MDELIVEDICMSYGTHTVLRGVSFALPAGSVLCLSGASGSGKSTLLKILCGLLLPSGGTVRQGETLLSGPGSATASYRRNMAMAFQTPALFPHMTVWQNLRYAARCDDETLRALCDAFDIQDIVHSRPTEISGGQAKRAELARALGAMPQILLLDEPTSHLDAALRERVVRTVLDRAAAQDASVLYVTHSQAELALLGAPVIHLHEGKITA